MHPLTSSDTGMRLDQGHRAVELQMELNEAPGQAQRVRRSCTARTTGLASDDRPDPLPLGIGKLAIHQHVQGASGDPPGRIEDIEADAGAKHRIGKRPAELAHRRSAAMTPPLTSRSLT